MTEDEVLKKYEREYSQYCFDALNITSGEVFLNKLENGDMWDWLRDYHPEVMEALDNEEKQKELDEIDRRMIFMHQENQYDPPMTETEEYLLKKQREEEYKSYDY